MSSSELDDPDYVRLLSHLRPDSTGRAYVFQIGGGPTIEYEKDDSGGGGGGGEEKNKNKNKNKKDEDEEEKWSLADWRETVLTGNVLVDGDYLTFLRSLRMSEEGSLLFDMRNNVAYQAEEAKQQEEEDKEDLHSSNRSRRSRQRPLDSSSGHQDDDGDDESFKSKLMRNLSSPFDQSEYYRLMKLATAKKPVVKYKHLRTDDIPYETEQLGLSYFDYYPELKKKVKHADRFSGLKLLRGFFFWLKHIEHKGAYKPWLSASSNCTVLPSRS